MRLLFVCTGNICRSPTAEAVARARIETLGLDWTVDSAATSAWHAGDAPDGRAVEAAARRGYDMTALVARPVETADYARFDHLVAMDAGHERILRRNTPAGSAARVTRLLDWADDCGAANVPDPWYGSQSGFERVLDLVETGVDGLIAALREEAGQARG